MKSDVCKILKRSSDLRIIPEESEKMAKCSALDEKQTRRLRLLSEELICMLPSLLEYGDGEFWIESEGKSFELHVCVDVDYRIIDRNRVLSVSSSGRNEAAKGILSKIRDAMECMIANRADDEDKYEFYAKGISSSGHHYSQSWSLESYRRRAARREEWDELEKSIIANLADDVLVGVLNNKVDIIVKKNFNKIGVL